jgi:peptidyl-prolyl cis-trans isomerase C
MIGAGVIVLAVLAAGALNEYAIRPRQTLASVGDTEIRRRDYWQARTAGLIEEANQFQQAATMGFAPPEQQQQYLEIARQRLAQVDEVWGSTTVDEATLQEMIDGQVYLQRMDELGLSLSDEEVDLALLQQFAPPNSLITPTPTATLIPARAAMATATAAALAATPSPPVATPIAAAPAASTIPLATPVDAAATPIASPVASPVPAATPAPADARATAEAEFARFEETVFPKARMDRDDYERLVVRPSLARQKVAGALAAEVGQSAEQVHAAHILVGTQELAAELAARLAGGADFGQLARENSVDEATGANGGDLGWFAREQMVPPFADAAFALQPGATSQPVETEFGWHLIRVIERSPDRPLTDEQISTLQAARVEQWLEEQRAAVDIESDLAPTPPPDPGTFEPPAGAPPPPSEPAATPVGSPPAASPVAGG